MRRILPSCRRRIVSSHVRRAGSRALAGALALARLLFPVLAESRRIPHLLMILACHAWLATAAHAGDFTMNLGTNPNWPANSTGPVNFTMTDQYGFRLNGTASIARIGGSAVSGFPDETNAFGTSTSIGVAWDAASGSSGVGESTNTATLSFSSGGSPFTVNALSFIVSDIDPTDNNDPADRCDFVTLTGNAGNPTLSYVSGNASARSVRIGPATGSGSTGALAANQAQCIYNIGTTASNTSNADDNGSILAVWPSGTSTATVRYDESIENVYGVTNRDAAGRGIGIWAATAIVVDQSISLSKSAGTSTFTGSGQTITYTYVVTNTGRLPINTSQDIVINDDKIGQFTCGTISSDVPVGGTISCTANYTTTAGDVSAAFVTNNAVAGVGTPGQSFATRLQSNSDSETVTYSPPAVNLTCPVGSTATGSGYASGGSGNFLEEVFWFDWNCGGTTDFGAGSTVTKTWSLPNGTSVTATLTGITQSISTYSSGGYVGDVFPSVYSGVNPVGLINTYNAQDPSYTITFAATHNGTPVSLDFVAADVEETSAGESLAISTSAGSFELIEQVGSLSVSGAGTGSVSITGTGGTALVSSYGSPTFNVSLTAGGKQAFGYGVRLKRDFSDAPTAGYGGGDHRRIGNWLIGAAATTEAADYNDPNAAGDADDGVSIPAMVQGMPATIPVTVSGSGGILQAWIDWNGDNSFGGAGEQIAADVQDGGAGDNDGTVNGTIELAVTVPPTAVTTQTFARFRWSTSSGLASSGSAGDGEIEDYALTVTAGNPSLTVTKSASDTVNVSVGQVITYTYTITNTGNQTISAIKLSDSHDGSGPAPAPDPDTATLTDNAPTGDSNNDTTGDGEWDALAPGDVLTVTGTYTITQNDVDTQQ